MKKLILIALAFVAIQATAQEKTKDHKKGNHKKCASFSEFSAEDIATIQTKKMTLHLDLNESQQREIQKINLNEATTRKAKMEAHKAKKESDTSKELSKEDRVAKMNEMLDHKIEVKAKMKKILNSEQYIKWEANQGKRSKGHRGKGQSKQCASQCKNKSANQCANKK